MPEDSRLPEAVLWRPEKDRLIPRITVLDNPATATRYSMDYFSAACAFTVKNIRPSSSAEQLDEALLLMERAAVLHHHLETCFPPERGTYVPTFNRQDYERTLALGAKTIRFNDVCAFFLQLTADYFENHMRGREPSPSPFIANMHDAIDLIGTLKTAIKYVPGLEKEDRENFDAHLATTAKWATQYFLQHNDIGFAGAMINLISDYYLQEEYVEEISRMLKEKIIKAPLSRDGKLVKFRTLRQHFMQTLIDPRIRMRFGELTPDVNEYPPEFLSNTKEAANASRLRTRREEVIVDLDDGYTVRLEEEYYEERRFIHDGTEIWLRQTEIHYEQLNEDAQKAVQIALKAAKNRHNPDSISHYVELGLCSTAPGDRPHLYIWNRVLPQEAGYEFPVYSTEESCDQTYIVFECPPAADLASVAPKSGQVNLFCSRPNVANAYWLSGRARHIIGDIDDADLMLTEEVDGAITYRPRWVIMPIDFFQITLTAPQLETPRPEKKWRLFGRIAKKG